jgi:hypothetical protein
MNTKGQRSSHRERLQRPVTMIVRLQRSINHDRQTGSEKPAAGWTAVGWATPFLRQRTPGAFSS